MEQQDRPSDQHPILCAKQCGFFGNPMFQNMCSKCFKEHQKEQQQTEVPAIAEVKSMETTSTPVVVEQPTTIQPEATVNPTVASPTAEVKAVESATTVTQEAVAEPSSVASNANEDKPSELPKQERKDRCYQCKVKLTLAKQISNQCRCGFIYCDSHRHSHECNFDHQQRQQEVLTALNPKVAMKTGGRSFNRLD